MANQSNVFPGFLKLQLDGNNVFAEFERKAAAAADSVERHFKGSLDEVARITQRALSQPLNGAGALDLGVNEMRQSAAAAEQRAQALRRVADAANAVAQREASLTGAQQAQTAAANAAAFAAEREAQTAREKVATYEILQRELDQTAAATARLTAASTTAITTSSRTVASIGQQRAGMQQLSYQIGDVSQQLALGVSPAIVFAQQMGQVVQAVQLTTGATTGLIGFLAGPWGAVLTGAVTVAGLWASSLLQGASAARDTITASDALSTAQGALGGMFDLATGKIRDNTDALRINALQMALNLRLQGQRQVLDSQRILRSASSVEAGQGAPGFGIADDPIGTGVRDILRETGINGTGPIDGRRAEQALRRLADMEADARRQRYSESRIDAITRAREAVNDRIQGSRAIQIGDDALRSVTTGQLASNLRRTPSGGSNRGGGGGNNAAALAEFGEDTGRRIANITARFTEAPPAVEAVRRAMAELDDIASDLERRRPPKYEALVTQLNAARTTVEQGLTGPFREWTEEQDRQRQIQALINQGRVEEAEILQTTFRLSEQQGKLDDEAVAEIRRRIELRTEENRQAEIERQRQQQYLQAIQSTRAGLEDAIANLNSRGLRGLGDVAQSLYGGFRQLTASDLVERLFGGTFRELEGYVSGRGRLRAANDDMADNAQGAAEQLEVLADAVKGVTEAITSGGSGGGLEKALGGAAKGLADSVKQAADDASEIVVTATRRSGSESGLYDLDPRNFAIRTITGLLGPLGLSEQLTRRISAGVTDAMSGAFLGQSAASILLGRSGSSTGSAIGGALGNVAGKALGDTFGKVLGSLGQFAGPLGSIAGGLLGGVVGNLFTSTPRASSTIGGSGSQLGISATTGTRSLRGQTITAADSVIGTVEKIAELFGGTVNAALGSVSIGVRKGSYRVDPTGQGRTKLSKGAVDFGEDAIAAVRAAVLDLVQDGVIVGLKQGTANLLRTGKDLDAAIAKAQDFESVFTSLKERIDPVGAALDALDLKFGRLSRIFGEAGASADDLAKLEQLYGLERAAAIKSASEQMTGSLRSLIDDLTVNSDARSLRERLSIAQAKYDPLAARVAAGDATAYDDFAEAARTLEQLKRAVFGSTTDYFAAADSILSLATSARDRQQGLVDAATGRPPLLGGTGDTPVVTAIDRLGDRIVDALETRLGGRLDAVNDNVGTMVRELAGRYYERGALGGGDRFNF